MTQQPDTTTTDNDDVIPRYWNYRVRGFTAFSNVPGVEPEEHFDIIEMYYNANDEPVAWGNTVGPLGESLDSLRRDILAMAEATDKHVLYEDDLPGQ